MSAPTPRQNGHSGGGETTVVHVMRHGEVHNPTGVLYGRLPHFRLSPAGEDMARTTADWFAGRDVTHLVASPLERAQQTAQPIADTLGLPIATEIARHHHATISHEDVLPGKKPPGTRFTVRFELGA